MEANEVEQHPLADFSIKVEARLELFLSIALPRLEVFSMSGHKAMMIH
jgi:hypothetical protein